MLKETVTLRKSEILRGRGQIHSILSKGTKLTGKCITCQYISGMGSDKGLQRIRVGFLTKNKSLNAVKRNRVRRLMREAYRHAKVRLERALPQENSLVIIFSFYRETRTVPSYSEVREDIEVLLQKIPSER